MKLEKFFFNYGSLIAKNPITTIIIAIFVLCVFMTGFFYLEIEGNPQQLWVAQDSKINYQQLYYNKHFGEFFRIDQFILRPADENQDVDLLTKPFLKAIYEIQGKMENGSISYNGVTYNVTDFCYKPAKGKSCIITSPMDYWKMELHKMETDPDIKETVECLFPNFKNQQTCTDRNGIPIQTLAILGGTSCLGNATSSHCAPCKKKAKALIVTFLLNNDKYLNFLSRKWEKDIFEEPIRQFNSNDTANTINGVKLKIDFMAQRSIPDELQIENSQNKIYVVISYLIMFVYVSISMGSFPSIMLSKVLVSLGGILIIIASVAAGVAISSFFHIKQSLISLEVVPFLILAIGVDNMFIITGSKDSKWKCKDIPKLIGLTMADVGPSITTAAITEFFAFIVGYLTNVPALQSFCLASAFAVLIDYILQMTVFVAIVTLDERRIVDKRFDIVPCFKTTKGVERKKSELSRKFFSDYFLNVVLSLPFRIVALILYIGLLVCSFLFFKYKKLGLNQEMSVRQGKGLDNYFESEFKYVQIGPPAYIILSNVDYTNSENDKILSELKNSLSAAKSVVNPIYFWQSSFKRYQQLVETPNMMQYCKEEVGDLEAVLKLPFEVQLKKFLQLKIFGSCCQNTSICGETYEEDIIFDEWGKVISTRMRFYHEALTTQSTYIDSLVEAKTVVEQFTNRLVLTKNSSHNFEINGENVYIPSAYPYSLFYVYFEQYLNIQGIMIMTILVSLIVIFVVIQIFMDIKTALIVTIFVTFCVFTLFGAMFLLNLIPGYYVQINAVSVVNWIISAGLSVEFNIHFTIFYFKSSFESPRDRIKDAMKRVGPSIFFGIVLTKIIGITVLVAAPSEIFKIYYFRMLIMIIVLGFIHGFLILPNFFTLLNIKGNNNKVEDKKISIIVEEIDK